MLDSLSYSVHTTLLELYYSIDSLLKNHKNMEHVMEDSEKSTLLQLIDD